MIATLKPGILQATDHDELDPQRRVELLRELFGVRRPMPGRLPGWLAEALLARFGRRKGDTSDDGLLSHALEQIGQRHPAWLDHTGIVTIGGQGVLVAEPYVHDLAAFEQARDFAEAVGLEFRFSCASWHHPPDTARILFLPPADGGVDNRRKVAQNSRSKEATAR